VQITVPITITGLDNLSAAIEVPDALNVAPELYETKAELVLALPLTQGSPYIPKDIFRLVIPGGVKSGDRVHVNTQWEATTPVTNYNTMIGRCIVANLDAVNDASVTSVNSITRAAENITPAEHHKVVLQGGWLPDMDTDGQDLVIHTVAYAGSTGSSPGHTLKVEQGYGHLQAAVWRAPSGN
jgi:hypothetical protein